RVHNAARADRVAHALVNAVLERNVNVGLKAFQSALSYHADDVVAVGDSGAAIGGGDDSGGQVIALDVALGELPDHIEVTRIDVGEGEGGLSELRNGQEVGHEPTRKADAPGSDHSDFERHSKVSPCGRIKTERDWRTGRGSPAKTGQKGDVHIA